MIIVYICRQEWNEGDNLMIFYAHSKENEPEQNWQTLREHLNNTADIASTFAKAFNGDELAWIAGIMHDIGKYSIEFQKKLRGEKLSVDHSTAGAQLAIEYYGQVLGMLLAYCIAGHHAGLPDYGTVNKSGSLAARLKSSVRDYKNYSDDIKLPKFNKALPLKVTSKEYQYFAIAFYIRMIYSCLVDADYLDTERFMQNGNVNRSIGEKMDMLHEKLMSHLDKFEGKEGYINKKRMEILKRCIDIAPNAKGFYSLTVPTGGGKTLSSLAFALKHIKANDGIRRIIYVIPYTSITALRF